MVDKTLDITSSADLVARVSDVKVFGDPDCWQLLCKASSVEQGWMKSTKVMQITGVGCVIQVTTQHGSNIAEALTFVPGAVLKGDRVVVG